MNPAGTITQMEETATHIARRPQNLPCSSSGMISASHESHGGAPIVPKKFATQIAVIRTVPAAALPLLHRKRAPTMPANLNTRSAMANQNHISFRLPVRSAIRAERICATMTQEDTLAMTPHWNGDIPMTVPKYTKYIPPMRVAHILPIAPV